MTAETKADAASFYVQAYREQRYARGTSPTDHFAYDQLKTFVETYKLQDCKCLELGCGRGAFQDLVADYTGVDLSSSVAPLMRKPFIICDAARLPFESHSFDALWSITMLEHVPDPEAVLQEMRRVLRPGGLMYLKPAWHCRPWICEGIPVRPYRDLNLRQRWVKATLPLRNSLPVRAAAAIPARVVHWLKNFVAGRSARLQYRRLKPDYETFWMVDSDAAVSLDPFDLILWHRNRGDEVLTHPSLSTAFLSRNEPLIVRVGRPHEQNRP